MKISGALRRGRKLPWLLLAVAAALFLAGIVRADDGDITPPSVTAFSITPPTVNTFGGGGEVDFHATITDDISGVASASITFHDPGGDPATTATLSNDGGNDYTASDFIYSGNEGTWTIDSIDVQDVDGNAQTYTSDDLAGMSLPTSFDVVNEPPPPSITDFEPPSGAIGEPITITGSAFSGASEVDFNGTPAPTYSVDSDSQITATVPDGATSGPITVVTPAGPGQSSSSFTVAGGGGGGPGPGTPTVELQSTSGSTAPSTYADISYRINPNGAFDTPQDVCVFSDDGSGGPIDINGDLSSAGATYDPSTYPAYETISVHASSDATGNYPLHVGLCDESAISDVYTLTVTTTPSYSFQLDNAEFTAAAGTTITPHLTVTADDGFTGTVHPFIATSDSDNTPPTGFAPQVWSDINVPSVQQDEDIPIAIDPGLDPGDYTFDVGTAVFGMPEQYTPVTVHVTAATAEPSVQAGVSTWIGSELDGSSDSVDGTQAQNGDESWFVYMTNVSGDPTAVLDNATITAESSAGQTFDPSIDFPDSQSTDALNPGDQLALSDFETAVVYDQPFTSNVSMTRSFQTISCDNTDACVDDGSLGGIDYSSGCPAMALPSGTATGDVVPNGDSLELVTVHFTPHVGSTPNQDIAIDASDLGGALSAAGLTATLIGCDYSGITGQTHDMATATSADVGFPNTNPDTAVFVLQVSNTGGSPAEFKPMVRVDSEGDQVTADSEDTSATISDSTIGGDVTFSGDETAQYQTQTQTSYSTILDELASPVVVTAPDGSGSMSVQPSSVVAGSDGNTLTFTYTAGTDNPADGGLNNGTVTLAVPAGWTAPQVDDSSADGYVTADNGTVDVSGMTITVSGLSMSSGDQLNITYGDTSGGGTGVSAPSGSGLQAFTAQEQSSDTGALTNLADADQASVALASPDGSGTMTASPSAFHVGDTNKTIVFTYTADTGGITQGTVELVVPSDWDAPQTDVSSDPGYVTASTGTAAILGDGQTISVTGVTLTSGQTFTITYANATPTGTGAEQWETLEQSYDPDGTAQTATDIATSPTVAVVAADGSGTVDAQDQNFNDPPSITGGSTGNTLTFTYTADDGGLANGTVTMAVPTGWDTPVADDGTDTTEQQNGLTTLQNAPDGATLSVSGRTVTVSGLNMNGGDQFSIVYGDTSLGGSGATAPTQTGAVVWTTQEMSAQGGTLTSLAADSQPTVVIAAPNGSGTMTASPSTFRVGDTHKTIVFTYTADTGGVSNGTVELIVPSDWDPPSTTGTDPGYTVASTGTLSVGDDGQTIIVTGLTLSPGESFTIVYGSKSGGGPGATPQGTVAEQWETLEQFYDSDGSGSNAIDIATQPTISVVAADGSGTMVATDESSDSPPVIEKSSTGHTLTFTYTAADGGLANGTVTLTVPAGWPAPTTNSAKAAYTTIDNGDATLSTKGQVITVSGLNMNGGDQLNITYGDPSSDPGTGVNAPSKTGNPDWTTTEQSLASPQGKATKIAVQPKVPVIGTPTVASIAPATAASGATVTIKGTNLAGVDDPTNGVIAFFDSSQNETDADITTAVVNAGGTAVTVVLPDGLAAGKYTFSVTNEFASSKPSTTKLNVVDAPEIDSLSVADAKVGQALTLTGLNLKGTSAVWFQGGTGNGVSAKPVSSNATTVRVKVPAGAISGTISVVNAGVHSNDSDPFTVDYATPTIKAITPATVAPTAIITITGVHFTGVQDSDNGGSVIVGGEPIDPSLVTWVSDSTLKVPVPGDLTPGATQVQVATGGGQSLLKTITVVAWPTIASVAPTSVKAGKAVTITGTGLKGSTLVTFAGGKTAKPTKSTATTITVTVPKGAQSGPFSVTNAGVTVDSGSVVLTIS